eukprot:CAMPEP_0178430550 /NCGR_PEP_ID=MMETSP0689_2-20121128/31378_1 /TAXON_ID=160604 /ORGANISM="Amphidinium massartii, Strain CS-259" /LENGTH=314 /DNA_ID=CAMNT_0020052411 /DNA_START=67 /DNA_END=1008 /DNA_ORIENTATION=+
MMFSSRGARRNLSSIRNDRLHLLVAVLLALALSQIGAAFVTGRYPSGASSVPDERFGGVSAAFNKGKAVRPSQTAAGMAWPAVGCIVALAAARSALARGAGKKGAAGITVKTIAPATRCNAYAPIAADFPASSAVVSQAPVDITPTAFKPVVSLPEMDLLSIGAVSSEVCAGVTVTLADTATVMAGAASAAAAAPQRRPSAAKHVGGARKASRNSRSARRAAAGVEHNERRHIGAKLHSMAAAAYQMPPLSYDVSRVRSKVQISLRVKSGVSRSMENDRRCCDLASMSTQDCLNENGPYFFLHTWPLNIIILIW